MDGVMVSDPTTVLAITTGLGSLQVGSVPSSGSEPTTPASDKSPVALDTSLRDWLNEANSSNPKIYIKLLVSNAAAGSVIGKGGGNINDVQAKTYARIQLSKANEYFPGTTERTLLVTGRLKQAVAALGLIFAKLLREGVAPLSPKSKAAAAFPPLLSGEGEETADVRPLRLLVRLLVPQPLCGVIIGKNGATIRNYAADTSTVIKVTSSEASQAPTSHRIVTIAGETEGVLKAIALMTLKQADDPKFPLYGELPSPAMARGAAVPQQFMPTYVPGLGSPTTGMFPLLSPAMAGHSVGADGFSSLTLILTEDQTLMLMDTRTPAEVEQMTGCRVRLDMQDGPRGPFGRLLLAGTPETVGYAQWLLGQRLAAAAASYQVSGTTYYHSPTFVPSVSPAFMGSPWLPAGLLPHQQQAQQQQHMMAVSAAAAGGHMLSGQGRRQPTMPRQYSGSSAGTP